MARVGEQAALKTALSYYNTGDPARGLSNGYAGKVATAAERIVPAIGGARLGNLPESAAVAPTEVPSPPWDVFGEVHRGRRSFVTTVSTPASGDSQ